MSRTDLRIDGHGRIDRSRSLSFTFNGRRLSGFAGDTLASALLANGVRVVARGFKFHRPRGILSAGVEEPNALFEVALNGTTIPLVRATLQPLVEGLSATSRNCYPSVDFDLGRVLDRVHRLWPAGFYNKTFKWPSWHAYEGLVRRAAGLGVVPPGADPAAYFHHNLHCDVLVVGGGPAGLAAALAAARDGARVVLLEQDREFGGSLLSERETIDGAPGLRWVESIVRELECIPHVRLLRRTCAAGYYDHNVLTALDHADAERSAGRIERFWRLRAREVVIATGAIEQPLIFAHNDRPGIVLAGAARQYLQRYGVAIGRNVVVVTNNDDAYRTALELHDAGVRIAALVDARAQSGVGVAAAARQRALSVLPSSVVVSTRGHPSVSSVEVSGVTPDGRTLQGQRQRIACDAIAMSAGWNPTVHLWSQAGGKVRHDERLGCIVPELCRQRVRIVGAANAEFDLAAAIESGGEAGRAAARDAGLDERAAPARRAVERMASDTRRITTFGLAPLRRTPDTRSDRQWVDFQHDVTVADIELAVRENYVSIEHLKRYTTNGMSVDQGKTSNLNALELLAGMTGQPVAAVGTTTYRPQFVPVTMGAIAGGVRDDLYLPTRQLPARAWHLAAEAHFDDYGGWKRPAWYRSNGATPREAIEREVRIVREAVGLFDASPLGKIEVRGPDAARFLDRIYVNNVGALAPGRCRYGVMLNENGIIIDDGVFARLAPDHFLVGTTSGQADRIAAWLEEWHQGEWPDLNVVMLSVTTQWAVLNLAGPQARGVLQSLDSDIDFSAAAFPHMSLRVGRIAGHEARVQRVSFSGELSYEISVPANRAEAFATELMQAGAGHGIEPVGLEAWLVLRLEKGFLHVGSDTDGTTNALDAGFGSIADRKPGDFIGRRSLARPNDRRADRRQLIGIEPFAATDQLVAGSHIVTGQGRARRSEGFVTSACVSPTLGRSIALGLLEGGSARLGETVTVFDQGRTLEARVVKPAFYDPDGTRMHG
jgi:sarcosine oxidase subunit alpha